MNHITQKEESKRDIAAENMEWDRLFRLIIDRQVDAGVAEPFSRLPGSVPSEQVAEVFLSLLSGNEIPNESMRDGIARSLGAECAYPYFDQIVSLYVAEKKSPREPFTLGSKEGFAHAIIEHAARHKERFDTIMELASDDSNGLTRIVFLKYYLRKSKDPRAHELIRDLTFNSPDLTLRTWLRNQDWKSYWMKREPELYKQWEAEAKAKKKAEKKAS